MDHARQAPATVAVDLTPVLQGGENGGAKVMALSLVQLLSGLARESKFILLTSRANHEPLGGLDAPNVRRFCVDAPAIERGGFENLALRARSLLSAWAPSGSLEKMAVLYRRLMQTQGAPSLLQRLGADVLFCPFLSPHFDDGRTPFVCIVADLQFVYLPEFFPDEERGRLHREFLDVARNATTIVCISNYVRETVVRAGVAKARTMVIHLALHGRLETASSADCRKGGISRWGLLPGSYLLYPANFWPHKNHATLIKAFRMFRRDHSEPALKLVLTGTHSTTRDCIVQMARSAGLADCVVFPGFVSDTELSALLSCSLALIFPSLYEGFGMPVLEAMAAGVPVLCSDVTSLPEIAGDAALTFDPRNPAAIAGAIAQVLRDSVLRDRLIEAGFRRQALFGSAHQMAEHYWDALCGAAAKPVAEVSAGCYPGIGSNGK